MPEPLVLDLEPLQDLTGGDPKILQELLEIYLEDVEERLQEFVKLLEIDDIKSTLRQIHTIKGSSATIGAKRVQASAMAIEKILRKEGSRTTFPALIQTLQEEFQKVKQDIEEMGF